MIYFIAILSIIHSNISNSVFGFMNPFYSIALFSLINFSIILDCFLQKKINTKIILLILIITILIILWWYKPEYKFYFGTLLVLCVSCYVNLLKYQNKIIFILKSIIYISAFLMIIQISGKSEFVHYWNSFYIEDFNGVISRNIVLQDIFLVPLDEFDSRQVRASGLFHSSAVLSMLIITYMAYIFNGYIKSSFPIFLIGYLIIFSGAKSSLIAFVVFSLIQRNFFKNKAIIIISGFIFATLCHLIIFPNLMLYNFDYDLFYYSLDIRFKEFYDIKFADFLDNINLNFNAFIPYLLVILISLFFFPLKTIQNKFLISLSAIIICFLTNNQANNYLAGLFLFPLLFSSYE